MPSACVDMDAQNSTAGRVQPLSAPPLQPMLLAGRMGSGGRGQPMNWSASLILQPGSSSTQHVSIWAPTVGPKLPLGCPNSPGSCPSYPYREPMSRGHLLSH